MSSDQKQRRAFSTAVFIFCEVDEPRVLLIEHKKLGCWLPLGGELEPGETPLEGALREVREESGFTEKEIEFLISSRIVNVPRGYFIYEEHEAGAKGLHMNFNFIGYARTLLEPVSDGSWTNYQWFTRSQARDLRAGRDGKVEGKIPRNVVEIIERVFASAEAKS